MSTIEIEYEYDYVSIASPELDRLDDHDILIPFKEAIIKITYPLTNPTEVIIKANKKEGFTKRDIVRCISKAYHKIYKEEKESTKIKIIPGNQRKVLYNRNTTDGKYGIWGHDIGDLVLSAIITEEKDNKIYLNLQIES
jgi:hypothetical protein